MAGVLRPLHPLPDRGGHLHRVQVGDALPAGGAPQVRHVPRDNR